jgi:hypothetical protein
LAILLNPQYRAALHGLVSSASSELALVAAYATAAGVESLFAAVASSVRRKEIHVRWRAEDLICGASELAVYELARERGFAVFMQQDLHAKFAISDRKNLILGSANLTGRGLGIVSQTNVEAGIVTTVGQPELEALENILSRSILVTPDIYDRLRSFVDRNKMPGSKGLVFPPEITSILEEKFTGLWVRDLPYGSLPPSQGGSDASGWDSELEMNFGQSKCMAWLRRLLHERGAEIYFGELTSALHDSVLEDPLPYRTEVKKLAANLINWCAALLPTQFAADTPNHSQRLRRI